MKAGDVYKTDFGGDCIVLNYTNNRTVKIRFLDEFCYERVVTKAFLEQSCVKNPYARKVFGVGYIGVGTYPIMGGAKHTLEYNTWTSRRPARIGMARASQVLYRRHQRRHWGIGFMRLSN